MYVEPIKEGPVEISFSDSGNKQRVTFDIDFDETELSSAEAANTFKCIVEILRKDLKVKLSRCK